MKTKLDYLIHRNMTLPNSPIAIEEHHLKMLAIDLLNIPTDENVRAALKNDNLVAKAVRDTIVNNTDWLHILNGGITIVSDRVVFDNASKTVTLYNPDIVNGAQSQEAIRKVFLENTAEGSSLIANNAIISVEVLVTSSDDDKAEISIARNNQTPVKVTSMMGIKGMFDGIEEAIQKTIPDFYMDKRESDDKYIDRVTIQTTRILQLLFLALPDDMRVVPYKISQPYSSAAKWLREFQLIWEIANGKKTEDDNLSIDQIRNGKKAYRFFLKNAACIIKTYIKWKIGYHAYSSYKHEDAFKRAKNNDIAKKEIHDGLLFPVLHTVYTHNFVNETPRLSSDQEKELMSFAMDLFDSVAATDPQRMGKNASNYSLLNKFFAKIA